MSSDRLTRRRFIGIAILAASSTAIAACAAAPETPTQAPAAPTQASAAATQAPKPTTVPAATVKPAAAAQVDLRVWHWDDFIKPAYEKAVAPELAKTNPNIKGAVELYTWDEYPQKLAAAVAGGAPPDVAAVTPHYGREYNYIMSEVIQVLDDRIKADKSLDMSDFNTINLKQHQWLGKYYALPYGWPTTIVLWNSDMFQKAGLASPTDQWKNGKFDWAAWRAASDKLTTGSGLDKQYGHMNTFVLDGFDAYLSEFVWANGGDLWSKDYSKSAFMEPATYETIKTFYDAKKNAPIGDVAQTGNFDTGKVGMTLIWDIHYIVKNGKVPFKYSMAGQLVAPKTGNYMYFSEAPAYSLPVGIKHADESWELLKAMLGKVAQNANFMEVGMPPASKALTKDLAFWKQNPNVLDPELMLAVEIQKDKTCRNPPKISNLQEMATAYNEEMTLIWADKETLDDGLKKLGQRWDELLKVSKVDPDNGS